MKRIWSTLTVIINNNNFPDERHLQKEESKRFKLDTKEEKVKMDYSHLQKKISIINNKFLMSVIISSLEKFQTEYTGTRPGDISISSCIGSFRSLIQTLFLDCNNNVARQEK